MSANNVVTRLYKQTHMSNIILYYCIYGGGNSYGMEAEIQLRTTEEVSKFPNPQLVDASKGIQSPKTHSKTYGWTAA